MSWKFNKAASGGRGEEDIRSILHQHLSSGTTAEQESLLGTTSSDPAQSHLDESQQITGQHVWAIGVGSALGGVFFGWQFVLAGGFYYAFLSLLMAAYFYWIYSRFISELSVRYQCTGGSFDFVSRALGTRHAIIVAILSLLKLIFANAATALAISSYMTEGGLSEHYKWIIWLILYAVFTALDCVGIRQSYTIQMIVTVVCILIVTFVIISNFNIFSWSDLNSTSGSTGAMFSWVGVYNWFQGLPFALQFFDGFEEVPLLMSYTKNAEVVVPRSILYCFFTIGCISLLVLVSCAGAIDVSVLLNSESPLMDGIEAFYGTASAVTYIVAYLIVLGLLVNFFAFILFSSQQIQSIAEAKFLPHVLTYRHPQTKAPVYASLLAMVLGIIVTVCASALMTEDAAQNTLLMAAIFPTIIIYLYVLQSVIHIRLVESGEEHGTNYHLARILGNDPGEKFRVPSARGQGRIAQCLCILFLVGIVALATTSFDYSYGLIVSCSIGLLLYMGMIQSVEKKIREEENEDSHFQEHQQSNQRIYDFYRGNNNNTDAPSTVAANNNNVRVQLKKSLSGDMLEL